MGSCADIRQIDPLRDPRWAEFVRSHPRASVFHSPQWLSALQATYGYRPVALTSSPPGVPLADGLPFCHIDSWLTGRRLVSLPFSDHCEPLFDSYGSSDLGHAWTSFFKNRIRYVEIRPIDFQPAATDVVRAEDHYLLHRLDLRPDLDSLHARFHKSCVHRAVRRAEKERLDYTEGSSALLLDQFYRLLTLTRREFGAPPQPLRWFRALIAAFGSDLKIRVASRDGRAIAAILTISSGNSMVYKYGGSDPEFRKLGGTSLLFWRAIHDAKAQGFELFDMGRSDIDNSGLISFKEHWGATATPLYYWRVPGRRLRELSSWPAVLAERAATVFPLGVLQAIGTVLYKHVG